MHIKVGIRYKILNLTMHDGYSSYTDLKRNFKEPFAMKIYNFLGYSSYTGYTDLKTTFKDPLSNK